MRRLGKVGLAFLVWFCALMDGKGQIVANGSFETPNLLSNAFQYDPSGATWLFTANSGIINAPGGGFFGPAAPDGAQYAFLQSAGAPGAFSESIDFTLAGTYQLSYLVAGRSDNGQGAGGDLNYQILLDSTVIATDTTNTAQPFTAQLFPFTTSAGSHTLSFEVAPGSSGDNTAFFDVVAVQPVPEPRSAVLFLSGLITIAATRRISSQRQYR